MDGLGPFEPAPRLALAVSGGADSLAAALLARDWAAARGGSVHAFVVDHGLRSQSAAEAQVTGTRLARLCVPHTVLSIRGLSPGPALAARARARRHQCLAEACVAAGILHLVFGQHAADQAETVAMRMLAGSGPHGLAAMAALVERAGVRLLRPLLGTPPAALRDLLRREGLAWVEDPSNVDPSQQRARLRLLRADPGGFGAATLALGASARARGQARRAAEQAVAEILGRRATIYPQGHALLSPGPIAPAALASLIATLSGAVRPHSEAALAALAAAPRPATIGGVRLMPAGRLGPGLLLVREAAAMARPIPAVAHALWDGRFRLARSQPCGVSIGAWGDAAPRDRNGWPLAVLRTLAVLRVGDAVIEPAQALLEGRHPHICFAPAHPAAGADFYPLPTVYG